MNVIDRARQEIETRGWCQTAWMNDAGEVCINGALREAARLPNSRVDVDAYVRAKTFVARYLIDAGLVDWDLAPGGGTCMWFNDAPGRSAEDVILALKGAAVRLDDEAAL